MQLQFLWIHLMLFMHLLNPQNGEIILIMWAYYNNNQILNQPMNEETVFHHHSKRNQFLIPSTFFCYYYYCTFSCFFLFFFFNGCFFSSKHIKIMFKVVKLILNIDIEGKVCPHHTVQLYKMEQKPILYDVNMPLKVSG